MMNKLVLFLLTALAGCCHAAKITFFEHSNFQGDQLTRDYEGLNCYNMPDNWNDKASSISTHDNCFLVFEHGNCEGRVERIAPGTKSHGHLDGIGFNDMISSYRQCSPSEDTCRQVTIDLDVSKAPEMRQFGERVKETLEKWYPFVCRLLWSPTLREVGRINLKFEPWDGGVAGAGGTQITGNSNYYKDHQDDVGSMIHEMAHIIQHYPMGCDWITEGIADYPRRWYFESPRPRKPRPGEKYKDHPVYFLTWVDERWPNTIYHLNRECREKTYTIDVWTRLTGKNPDQLAEQMMNEN